MMRINLNLREKLLLVVISGLLVAFSVLGFFRINQAKVSVTEEMNRSGQERVTLVSESLANLILAYDYSNIESLADRIVKLQDVTNIRVLNRNGKTMVSRSGSDESKQLPGVIFFAPILFNGETIGSVELELSLERLNESIKTTYQNSILALTVFAIFLGTLIYITVSRFIVNPLLRLSEAADQLALGDFSTTLPAATNDEIGKLVQAFSSMREIRKRAENELNDLNASLESIVTARIGD